MTVPDNVMGASAGAPWLDAELVTLAWCWRVQRRDGMILGLTGHDRDLMMGGLVYRAAPGLTPSVIEQRDGLGSATMDVEGALTHAAFTAADLDAGRWDGATVALYAVDWTAPDVAPLLMARGMMGAVERSGAAFKAELRDGGPTLDAAVAPQTQPGCRAELGDRACRVPLLPLIARADVVAIDGNEVTVEWVSGGVSDGVPLAAFRYGRVRWLGGAARGLATRVADIVGDRLILSTLPPFALALPQRIEIAQGCDKTLMTCRTRFNNAVNFRGEAHLPGVDFITRYPGA